LRGVKREDLFPSRPVFLLWRWQDRRDSPRACIPCSFFFFNEHKRHFLFPSSLEQEWRSRLLTLSLGLAMQRPLGRHEGSNVFCTLLVSPLQVQYQPPPPPNPRDRSSFFFFPKLAARAEIDLLGLPPALPLFDTRSLVPGQWRSPSICNPILVFSLSVIADIPFFPQTAPSFSICSALFLLPNFPPFISAIPTPIRSPSTNPPSLPHRFRTLDHSIPFLPSGPSSSNVGRRKSFLGTSVLWGRPFSPLKQAVMPDPRSIFRHCLPSLRIHKRRKAAGSSRRP